MTAVDGRGADFFISYTASDRGWAEWIAITLENAGYRTELQSFDHLPGADFVQEMHDATASADRIIAVLSPEYLRSSFGTAEWRTAFARDPSGRLGVLVPVLVEPCEPPGLLSTRIRIELVGLDGDSARRELLAGVGRARRPSAVPYPSPTRGTGGVSGGWTRVAGSGRWVRPLAVAPALLATLVLAASAEGPPETLWPSVSGTVSCASGALVRGIWLDATNGPAGWVHSVNRNEVTGRTAYNYGTEPVAGYELRVGCGGTTEEWAVKAATEVVPGPVADFDCDDIPASPDFATCRLLPG